MVLFDFGVFTCVCTAVTAAANSHHSCLDRSRQCRQTGNNKSLLQRGLDPSPPNWNNCVWGWRLNPGSCSKAPPFINQLISASLSVQICSFFKYGREDSVVLYLCKMYFSVQNDRHTVFEFSSWYQLLVLTRKMLHSRSIVIAFSYGKHITLPKQDSTNCCELKQTRCAYGTGDF